MTHPTYLSIYESLLLPDGSFLMKHDSLEFFNWSLEQLVAQKWHMTELSFDLHESELSEDYKVTTSYENRWLEDGRRTQFVAAQVLE